MTVFGGWSAPSGYTPAGGAPWLSYANGYWFAVVLAYDDTVSVWYATDPTGTWIAADIPGLDTVDVTGKVSYGGGVWAFMQTADFGGLALIHTTTDPAGTWSTTSVGGDVYDPEHDTTVGPFFNRLAYGDGTWALVGLGTVPDWFATPILGYATAIDGTWTWVTGASTGYNDNTPIGDIAWSGAHWVTSGATLDESFNEYSTVRYATTIDGTWSTPSTPPDLGYGAPEWLNIRTTYVLAYANGYWVGLLSDTAENPHIVYTDDPTGTWTVVDVSTIGFDTFSELQDIAYIAGEWVIVGILPTPIMALATSGPPSSTFTAVPGHGFSLPLEIVTLALATDGTTIVASAYDTGEIRYNGGGTPPPPVLTARHHLRQRQTF